MEKIPGYQSIDVTAKCSSIPELWQPRVIAELNEYQFKVVRIEGDFVWHDHADTDEAFFVLKGRLRIDFPDGVVHLGPGELFVVPRGVRHKPFAESETMVMLVEPRGVPNTGDEGGERTAELDVWI